MVFKCQIVQDLLMLLALSGDNKRKYNTMDISIIVGVLSRSALGWLDDLNLTFFYYLSIRLRASKDLEQFDIWKSWNNYKVAKLTSIQLLQEFHSFIW